MANKVNKDALPPDLGIIAMEDLIGGRRHINELYSQAEHYDHWQMQFWCDYFDMIAMSCFEWLNVPAGIDVRAIEYILWHFGAGALFQDFGGFLFAQAMPMEMVNMYYNPNAVQLFAPNGKYWHRHCQTWTEQMPDGKWIVNQPDAVVCFDNLLRRDLKRYTRNYAQRIAKLDRIADVNAGAQRTPFIIRGSETARGTRKSLIKKLEANEQYLEINDQLAAMDMPVEVLNTAAPYVVDKLLTDKKRLVDECLNMLGVDNSNTDKRERLITDEVLSNNEQNTMARNSRLKARKEFCRYVNNLFGLNIDVRWSAPHVREDGQVIDGEGNELGGDQDVD